ncbi:MAG: amidohydrolase [Flavobacteriales bacterium]|nr:MAG: amidohydrolase [Flavobacteriales bacterium]
MRLQIKRILKFFFAFCLITSCQYRKADWVVFNANVYTVNDSFEKVTAFAIKNGKFLSVGGDEIIDLYPNALKFDAKGLPIYPGFIDAHCHFFNLGLSLTQVDLRGSKSIGEIEKRLLSYNKNSPSDIIIGSGWDQNLWKNKAFPNNIFLNRLFPDKSVLLKRIDGHALLVNDYVIKKAGISSKTKVKGGSILVENNKPTGVLVDNAMDLAMGILPPNTSKDITKALIDAEKKALENGLTTVDDAGLDKKTIQVIDSLQEIGELKIRVYAMISNTNDNLNYYLTNGIIQKEKLTVRSVKAYLDGALGSRGALLKNPYSDENKSKGLTITTKEKLFDLANKLSSKGFQLNTHAIGDKANEIVLDVYNYILKDIEDPRWRVEHAQVVDEFDIQKFNSKIIPSVQPTHATSDMNWADERLGRKRLNRAYAYKELLDWSGKIALGTDFPVEKVNPLLTFHSAVARKDVDGNPSEGFLKENALTRNEALKGMTIWAAYSNFEDSFKGSIEKGKFADFVILTKDIMKVPEEEITSAEVVATIVNGSIVFQKFD